MGGAPESTRSDCSLGPRLRAATSARVAITTCGPCKHTYGILSKTLPHAEPMPSINFPLVFTMSGPPDNFAYLARLLPGYLGESVKIGGS